MNTADRQLMQAILEAMEDLHRTGDTQVFDLYAAPELIPALRERLAHCDRCGKKLGGEGDIHTCTPDPIGDAQSALIAEMAAQPEQEPVIFCMHWEDRWGVNHYVDPKEPHPAQAKPLYTTPPAAQPAPVQEPVAWLHPANATCVTTDPTAYARGIPLYTTPPAAAPMTEFEEAVAAVDNTLHHAIDHWQDRALKAEALLAQPEQEPTEQNVYLHDGPEWNGRFEAWWEDQGQFCRAGGGEYEKTFAFRAWEAALATPPAAQHQCKWPTCQSEEYQQKLAEQINRELVSTPAAQRQWVGLTPEEIDKTHETQVWDARRSFARAIEAKLKEKNT